MDTQNQAASLAPFGEISTQGKQNNNKTSNKTANKENPCQGSAAMSQKHSGKKHHVHCPTPRGSVADENITPFAE